MVPIGRTLLQLYTFDLMNAQVNGILQQLIQSYETDRLEWKESSGREIIMLLLL